MKEPQKNAPPEGWFVRNQVGHRGDITFTVMKMVPRQHHLPAEETDLKLTVKREAGWLHNLVYGSFNERVASAMSRAQKRAWSLNQDYKASMQLAYDMMHQTKKANPHDD
jgi:hypothetical protein